MTVVQIGLDSLGSGVLVLESIDIDCRLTGMLEETTITQNYRNSESFSIEAIYTFPLPIDAVLLGLEITLNGQTLQGEIEPTNSAQARYKHAPDAGRSSVLFETAGPDAYTLNVGQLMAGEQAVVVLRYAQLHQGLGDSLHLQLPTMIAPQYRDSTDAGLTPHQVRKSSLDENPEFTLCVSLQGVLARTSWQCPSHFISVLSRPDETRISVSSTIAAMGSNFLLILAQPAAEMMPGIWVPVGEGAVALASFNPKFPASPASPAGMVATPRTVTLMVDCSYSMHGNSFDQARTALYEILALLSPADRFNIIAFGSNCEPLFAEPVTATPDRIARATQFVRQLHTLMGAADISTALRACWQLSDVLLITDGAVWEADTLVAEARDCGSRVFSLGVGRAVRPTFLTQLAEASRGACEIVPPNEPVTEHILRHLRRLDQPQPADIKVSWPTTVRIQSPARINRVYAGDTLNLFGWLDAPPNGTATLTITLEDGRVLTSEVDLSAQQKIASQSALMTDLPRIAAYARLPELSQGEATTLAVEHQLVSDDASYVLVRQRSAANQTNQPPALDKLPQGQAAGQDIIGSVSILEKAASISPPKTEADLLLTAHCPPSGSGFDDDTTPPQHPGSVLAPYDVTETEMPPKDPPEAAKPALEIPEFLLPSDKADESVTAEGRAALLPFPKNLIETARTLNSHYASNNSDAVAKLDLNWLSELGLAPEHINNLADLVGAPCTEHQVVLATLQNIDEWSHYRAEELAQVHLDRLGSWGLQLRYQQRLDLLVQVNRIFFRTFEVSCTVRRCSTKSHTP